MTSSSLENAHGGVAGCLLAGLVHKHQLEAGVRKPSAQKFLIEPKHLTMSDNQKVSSQVLFKFLLVLGLLGLHEC